jgi:hypothetical protein
MEVSTSHTTKPLQPSDRVDLIDLVEASRDKDNSPRDRSEHKDNDDSRVTEDEGGGGDAEDESERPIQHVVADGETLARVAAKYDVTPSELAQLNRLGMGRMIFPGQVLKIPPPAPPPRPVTPPKPAAEDLEVIEYQFIKLKVMHLLMIYKILLILKVYFLFQEDTFYVIFKNQLRLPKVYVMVFLGAQC